MIRIDDAGWGSPTGNAVVGPDARYADLLESLGVAFVRMRSLAAGQTATQGAGET